MKYKNQAYTKWLRPPFNVPQFKMEESKLHLFKNLQ